MHIEQESRLRIPQPDQPITKTQIYALFVDSAGDPILDSDGERQVVAIQSPNGFLQIESPDLDEALGTKSDVTVVTPASDASVIALLKGILSKTGEVNLDVDAINLNTDGLEALLAAIRDGVDNSSFSLLKGTATSGSDVTLVDNTKNFEPTSLNDKLIKITLGGVEYIREITGSILSAVSFNSLYPGLPDSVTVTGSTGGSMVINCRAVGASGYSVLLVNGVGLGQNMAISFANDLLSITSATDGAGVPVAIMPGNVEGLIESTPALAALFDVGAYQAGFPLDVFVDPVPFTGGADPIEVVSGTPYEIITQEENINIQIGGVDVSATNPIPTRLAGSSLTEQKTQADADNNVITFSTNILAIDIYHAEATWQDFVVNGLTLKVPAGGYRTSIGGTLGATVGIPAGINCIVGRLV